MKEFEDFQNLKESIIVREFLRNHKDFKEFYAEVLAAVSRSARQLYSSPLAEILGIGLESEMSRQDRSPNVV